ncbi:MAG: tRNA (cytidine(34)-2'-O)-methyltransferase [Pseudomonadota bacterium]|nr:tRNA (cytidine(34)-2'-O)-methyltransferase [Pseudomonadota bacterium]
MEIALFEPDIPQNTGALMRLAACLGARLHIIEPCGFPWEIRRIKRTALDYYELADIMRHSSWQAFLDFRQIQQPGRLVLLTTKAPVPYTDFSFATADTLLLGRESAGVPDYVRGAVDAQVTIPMRSEARSLNVAMAAAMVLGEALRQVNNVTT